MKMKSFCFAVLLLTAAGISAAPAPVERGKLPTLERPERKISVSKNSAAVLTGKNTFIVISPQAGKVTRFAAEELKKFLSQVLHSNIFITTTQL